MGATTSCLSNGGRSLLSASSTGNVEAVRQVLEAKPELANYTAFASYNNCIHNAAVNGHVRVIQAVVEVLQTTAKDIAGMDTGDLKIKTISVVTWGRFLKDVLNQRTSQGQTPLMLACEAGHADCVEFLLSQGADVFAVDRVQRRSAVHYAAAAGKVAVLRKLLDDGTKLHTEEGLQALKHVRVHDMSGQCRYIDSRAENGMTALHLAAMAGELDCVQALLSAGASMMVRTVDLDMPSLTPVPAGSTPLHLAAMRGHVAIVQAMLQAHADALGTWGRNPAADGQASRRAWEGDGRIDLRSVANCLRQLPYHVAYHRGFREAAGILNPTVPIDAALESVREMDEGFGPQKLQTLAAYALRANLLMWLRTYKAEQEFLRAKLVSSKPAREAGAKPAEANGAAAAVMPSVNETDETETGSNTSMTTPAVSRMLQPATSLRASIRQRFSGASVFDASHSGFTDPGFPAGPATTAGAAVLIMGRPPAPAGASVLSMERLPAPTAGTAGPGRLAAEPEAAADIERAAAAAVAAVDAAEASSISAVWDRINAQGSASTSSTAGIVVAPTRTAQCPAPSAGQLAQAVVTPERPHARPQRTRSILKRGNSSSGAAETSLEVPVKLVSLGALRDIPGTVNQSVTEGTAGAPVDQSGDLGLMLPALPTIASVGSSQEAGSRGLDDAAVAAAATAAASSSQPVDAQAEQPGMVPMASAAAQCRAEAGSSTAQEGSTSQNVSLSRSPVQCETSGSAAADAPSVSGRPPVELEGTPAGTGSSGRGAEADTAAPQHLASMEHSLSASTSAAVLAPDTPADTERPPASSPVPVPASEDLPKQEQPEAAGSAAAAPERLQPDASGSAAASPERLQLEAGSGADQPVHRSQFTTPVASPSESFSHYSPPQQEGVLFASPFAAFAASPDLSFDSPRNSEAADPTPMQLQMDARRSSLPKALLARLGGRGGSDWSLTLLARRQNSSPADLLSLSSSQRRSTKAARAAATLSGANSARLPAGEAAMSMAVAAQQHALALPTSISFRRTHSLAEDLDMSRLDMGQRAASRQYSTLKRTLSSFRRSRPTKVVSRAASGKDLWRQASIQGFDDDEVDHDCGICLDRQDEVAINGCNHALCVDCSISLCEVNKKPPLCPFCRRMISGFHGL